MGRFITIAVAFFLAAMLAVSSAHAGRTLHERSEPLHAAVVSKASDWWLPRTPDGLRYGEGILSIPDGAAGPAADPEDVSIVLAKLGGRDINGYNKTPVFGP
ncbi:hypothetical protein ACP70R_039388 [Stipagrostis hirtigluma subsp. patula]